MNGHPSPTPTTCVCVCGWSYVCVCVWSILCVCIRVRVCDRKSLWSSSKLMFFPCMRSYVFSLCIRIDLWRYVYYQQREGGEGDGGQSFLLSPSPFTPPPSLFFQILAPWYICIWYIYTSLYVYMYIFIHLYMYIYSVLQCVAVCCSVLQCIAECCSVSW